MRKVFKHLFLGSLLSAALPLSVISCTNKNNNTDTNNSSEHKVGDNQTPPNTPKTPKQIWDETPYGDERDWILEYYKNNREARDFKRQFQRPETWVVKLFDDGLKKSALERNEFKFQLKILNPENIWWKYGFDLTLEYTYEEYYKKDITDNYETSKALEFGKDKPFKTTVKWIKRGKGDRTKFFEHEWEKNIEPALLEFTITLPNIKGFEGKKISARNIFLSKIYDNFGYEYESGNIIEVGLNL